jgi:hypothetical protein
MVRNIIFLNKKKREEGDDVSKGSNKKMTCKGLKLACLVDLCAETVSSSARHLPVIPPLHYYDSTVFRFTCWIVKGCLQNIYKCVILYDNIRCTETCDPAVLTRFACFYFLDSSFGVHVYHPCNVLLVY